MRFHVKTRPEHVSWAWMREIWVAADGIPLFESAWHWDHFYPLTGDLNGSNLEGWTTLAALAEATSRIRVGCQVTGMIYRHPAVLANMASAVDVISGGRLELGVGAGWNELETAAYGIELRSLKQRFDAFDEGVQVLIGLLTQEETTFQGEYYQLTNARNEPKGVQKPHPPITIGGKGPRRTLGAVARWAQQWNAIVSGPAEWQDLKGVLIERCAEIGRDPAEIDCSVNVMLPGGDDAAVAHAAQRAAAFRDAGVDIVVMNLPHNAPAEVLDGLATALSEL
jgi:F420-dependent oxidoreductase-like protein